MKINDIDWSKVPDILAKEQVRLLCHCSKRTALYYLKSGKLPCIYSGKKTRCYKIRKEDLMAFIEDRENHPEFYAVPEGWYKESGRTVRQHYSSEIKIDGEDLHEYYRFLLKEYPDVLEVKKVSEITGYAIPVINRWCNKGKVKYFSIRAMNMIPKIYLIDFFCSNAFRTILHNRRALAKYCYCTPQSRMQEEPGYYGVRVDTEKYAYLLRLNPDRGEYNLYCYCYRRDWLDQHLKDAEKGIRFIDSHYKELFRIPDGGKVKIHYSWNEDQIRTCRYIDDYHVEIGSNLYHICEFAERMEYGGHTCEPIRDNLPERCYSVLSGSDEIIIIKRGEKGYFKTDIPVTDKDEARSIVNEYNTKLGVSRSQEEAMKAGSMFGFQVPAADPRNYDADGKPVMPKDRGDAR